jgi:phosphoglycerol transferase
MGKKVFYFAVAIAAILLYACSDTPSAKMPAPAVQAHDATLRDGIDFTKPDYPPFVAETQGISGHEPWGRWTEGEKAVIKFRDNLPRSFVLELLVGTAFGPNADAPVRVRVGTKELLFLLTKKNETVRLDFSTDGNVNTIEILITKPASPKSLNVNNDERRLGIGLVRLRLLPK